MLNTLTTFLPNVISHSAKIVYIYVCMYILFLLICYLCNLSLDKIELSRINNAIYCFCVFMTRMICLVYFICQISIFSDLLEPLEPILCPNNDPLTHTCYELMKENRSCTVITFDTCNDVQHGHHHHHGRHWWVQRYVSK